jgi:hydrocephalus-inducing protein
VAFDYNWKVNMEDARRAFTPTIQASTPTPEHSQSPPPGGRQGGKSNKSQSDASVSPSRRANNNKDAKDTKKDGGKGTATQGKKSLSTSQSKENLEESVKPVKGAAKKKDRESKMNNNADEESAIKQSKDRDLLDASSKLTQHDQNEQVTKVSDNDMANIVRPDSQAQMRAESSLSHYSPSTIGETGYVPFMVEPSFGKLEPGKSQVFKVKFSPLNINDYQARLVCNIPNTEDGKVGAMIAVKGRGLLPYCHFELEESDYITSGRRNPDLPGPAGAASGLGLDPMTKVIEFNCVGLKNRVKKKFDIINPTNVDYEFEWIKEEQNDAKKHDEFTCLVPSGTLLSGRKYEIVFEFDSNAMGISENFWRFSIPKYNLSVPFLLVGNVTEPKVTFDRSHVSFKSLLVHKTGIETVNLVNQDNVPIYYEFDQTTCYTEGRSGVVLVQPSSGLLAANSKTPIQLSFQPKEQRLYIFNLKCKFGNSNKPLNLNVKGEGFAMVTSLLCEDTASGNKIELSDSSINEIHMGEVEKNEICFRNLYVVNNSKHIVSFEWLLTSQFEDALGCFSIEPQLGEIAAGDKRHCVLKYTAKLEKSTIANLILNIQNGSIYHIHLDGIAVKPDLQFSFNEYDFGSCFVYKAGMKLNTVELQMANRGVKDLNISCLTELTNSAFQFDFKQVILAPGKCNTLPITFIPRECKNYKENLIFELNGLTRRQVSISGTGTQLRIDLVDAKNKLFDVGTLEIGKTSRKTLQIVNKSFSPIDFNLLFEPKSDYLLADKNILQIQPIQNINLKPNQTMDLCFKFAPKTRIPKFSEDLNIEFNGIYLPLCTIQGACHGHNIWLEINSLPFGAIGQKCSTTKRIVMHNDGDIGASFKWDTEKMKPEFSITPTIGYISPGMEVNFDVTFNPQELSNDIRKEKIKCFVEGIQPLCLTLSGSCVQVLPQKEIVHFETLVRQKDTKQITLSNKTNGVWELKPVVEGDYFSGLESFIVEPQSSNSYDISYNPLTMAYLEGKRHLGSVFFSLPDGTGLLYSLSGMANPPKPLGKIQREVPCKTQFVELLMIENWLKKPQRFKVSFEYNTTRQTDKVDTSSIIKGHDYIDVPASGKKEYKLNYYAHKEGVNLLKVVLKNEQTSEYCFYEIAFKAVKSGSLATIELATQVRVPISYSIKLENPLANTVTFNATCSNNTEVLIPTNLSITGKGQVNKNAQFFYLFNLLILFFRFYLKGDFNFEFLPLKVSESTCKLELNSSDLGQFVYDLNLKAVPAAMERPIHFKTWLGSSQTQTAKFTNFSRQKTDYTCKV